MATSMDGFLDDVFTKPGSKMTNPQNMQPAHMDEIDLYDEPEIEITPMEPFNLSHAKKVDELYDRIINSSVYKSTDTKQQIRDFLQIKNGTEQIEAEIKRIREFIQDERLMVTDETLKNAGPDKLYKFAERLKSIMSASQDMTLHQICVMCNSTRNLLHKTTTASMSASGKLEVHNMDDDQN
jgi:hypothetical protein